MKRSLECGPGVPGRILDRTKALSCSCATVALTLAMAGLLDGHFAAPAFAQTWNGSTSAEWENGANWFGGDAPESDGVVSVIGGFPIDNQPTLGSATTIEELEVRLDGALTIDGADAHLSVQGTTVVGGVVSAGEISLVDGGGLTAVGGVVIRNSSSVNIGAGSTLEGDIRTRGELDNAGTVSGETHVLDGLVRNRTGGVLEGAVTVEGGGLNNGGVIEELVTVGADGTLNNFAGGRLDGGLDNSGMATNWAGGVIGSVVNRDGSFVNTGTVSGPTQVLGGLVRNRPGGVLEGAVTVEGGTLNNGGVIEELATVGTDGTLNNLGGGRLDGGLDNSGTATNAENGVIASVVNRAGSFTNAGTVSGTTQVTGGLVTNEASGVLEGKAWVWDGRLDNSGRIDGVAAVGADGTLNNLAGGVLDGGLDNSGTATNAETGVIAVVVNRAGSFTNAGTVSGTTRVTGGLVTNEASGVLEGAVTVEGGTLRNGGVIEQLATVDAGGTLNNLAGGRLDGGLNNSGSATNAAGGVIASVVNQAGSFTNAGTVSGTARVVSGVVTNEASGILEGAVTVEGGTLRNRGTLSAGLVNQANGTVFNSGLIEGSFDNAGRAFVQGTINGPITNRADASFALEGNLSTAGIFDNRGTFSSDGVHVLAGLTEFNNRAGSVLSVRQSLTIDGGATFINDGAVSMSGGPVNNAEGASDVLTVNGDLSGSETGSYTLDLYLASNNGGTGSTADRIVVNGNMSGSGAVNFVVDPNAPRVLLDNPIVVFDVSGTNSSDLTAAGLPTASGIVLYDFGKQGSDWVVTTGVNPAAGSIAGSLALIDSMVGTVVNRPGSAFVGGLAYEAKPNECGLGPWSRATGGASRISGTTTGGLRDQVAEVEAYYGGYQAGGDFQCFNLGSSGWDVAFGGFGGFNIGKSTQTVETEISPASVSADFNQYYAGLYASAAKGPFVAELQGRFDYTNYELNSPAIGLFGTETDATRYSVSATTGYTFQMGSYSLVPTLGASVSYLNIDELVFESDHTLEFDKRWSVVAFGGATLARSFLNTDKTAAYRPFVTGTVYSDFGAEAESTFFDPQSGVSQNLSSEGVGTFGEVSVGVDYVKIFQDRGLFGRQLNATIRGDLKFSDRLLSGGGTVQMRLQF